MHVQNLVYFVKKLVNLKGSENLRTQTKCTFGLIGLLIVEITPIPFTALYCIYAIRKRPAWIPETVANLYADKPVDPNKPVREISVDGHDPMKTRRNCTFAIVTMLIIDIIVPFTVPFGLYIVRKRPSWFKNVATRLYADQLQNSALGQKNTAEVTNAADDISQFIDRRYQELESSNFDFAQTIQKKVG